MLNYDNLRELAEHDPLLEYVLELKQRDPEVLMLEYRDDFGNRVLMPSRDVTRMFFELNVFGWTYYDNTILPDEIIIDCTADRLGKWLERLDL